MSNEQLQDLQDLNLVDRKVVDLGNSLVALRGNRDFRRVIEEGYFRDEAIRLVLAKGDPNMQTPERQASIIRDIDAIAALHSYLRTVQQQAAISARNIDQTDREIEELEKD